MERLHCRMFSLNKFLLLCSGLVFSANISYADATSQNQTMPRLSSSTISNIVGIKKLKIKIIDPVRLKDVRKLTKKGRSDKRVTLDLDEVIFCAADGPAADKSLPLPLKRMQNASIRLGIPALLYELGGHGFDIWIYTSQYYSLELQCQRGRFFLTIIVSTRYSCCQRSNRG